jgi:D-amino peptidase
MQVYVVADMEGVSGIVNIQQVSLGAPEFQEGRALLTGDVNAAVAGAFDGGATRVVVCDYHDSRRNLQLADLDPRAEYEVAHGRCLPALGRDFAAVVVVGMHAKSGTPRAFLEHTCDPAWHRYAVNGAEQGELALIAFDAGALGVPVVFVAGDRAAVEEARSLVPNVEGVIVKEGLARDWCRAVTPATAQQRIRNGVARALERRRECDPVALAFPVPVRLEFNRCDGADALDRRPGMTRVDGFTVEWIADGPQGLWP